MNKDIINLHNETLELHQKIMDLTIDKMNLFDTMTKIDVKIAKAKDQLEAVDSIINYKLMTL